MGRSDTGSGQAVTTEEGRRFFLVDSVLPAMSLSDLETAQRALEEAGRRMASEGEPVDCLRSTYLPRQRRWLCLFAADSADSVRKTHEIAQFPVHHVEEAVDLLVPRS